MNVFEAVKQSVTTRQAAEHYGIRVGRNGMACCPFHNDKTPSMKLDRRYHCFGCGADGDVIDFAAALYGLCLLYTSEVIQNRYLEANDRPERVDLRSYARQGLDIIPTVHEGAAVRQMEKRGIQTNIGNLNR